MIHRYMIIFTFSTESAPQPGTGRVYWENDKPLTPADILDIEKEIKEEQRKKINEETFTLLFVSGFYKFED